MTTDALIIGIIGGILIIFFIIVIFNKLIVGNKPKKATKYNIANVSVPVKKEQTSKQVIQETEEKKNKTIFLSYRRNDSADVSGRVYDRLSMKYGKENIFKDVDSIPLGYDFRAYIDEMVSRAEIFLVVIGPDWLGDDGKNRRIDDRRDFVRLEVQSALERNIPVIPLLVRNASMPSEHELPQEIQALSFRNGVPIRPDPDFDNDITRLMSGLNKLSNKEKSADNLIVE